MPRFAANLTTLFGEWSFLDRFDAAADAGFEAVEYLFPYDFAPDAIAARLAKNRLVQALFNLPPGDFARAIAASPHCPTVLARSRRAFSRRSSMQKRPAPRGFI